MNPGQVPDFLLWLFAVSSFDSQREDTSLVALQGADVDDVAGDFFVEFVANADEYAIVHRISGAFGGEAALDPPVGFGRRPAVGFVEAEVSLASRTNGCAGKDGGLAMGTGAS